jgi:tetrahydromethanopterin S-methyltransferase subunit A
VGVFQNLVKLVKPVIPRAGKESEWPFVGGHYRICTRSAPVVVVVPRDGKFAAELAAAAPEGLCMTAELASVEDISKLVRNLSSNLSIEYVVFANGASDKSRLLAATRRLWDEKLKMELPKDTEIAVNRLRNELGDELDALRKQIKAIDMTAVTSPDALRSRIEEITSDAKRQTTGFVAPESGEAQDSERVIAVSGVTYIQKPDKAGDFSIALRGKNIVLTHTNRKGAVLRTVEGTTARDIYLTLIQNGWVAKLDHAAYLGAELARAEIGLRTGMAYTQTKPPAASATDD